VQFITETKRVTTCFLQAIPPRITHFDAYLCAIVARKPDKIIPEAECGTQVRLDPCVFDWESKTISMRIPVDMNDGITSFEDLEPNYYECVEAAFISLIHNV
jgi:hypothetical protein